MGMDEAPVRKRRLELAAQLAHIDVDRAISGALFAAPHGLVELVARDDRAETPGHRHEHFELSYGEHQGLPGREHEPFLGPDLELARIEDVCRDLSALRALRIDRHDAAPSQAACARALQTRDLVVKNP